MDTERAKNIKTVHHALTTYAFNVSTLSGDGLTDLAKSAEDALIEIVNLAYHCNFVNINRHHNNYPGIDWKESHYHTGLQITTTKGIEKIKDSIRKIVDNKVDVSRCVWFLLVSTDKYKPKAEEYLGYKIQVITIYDLIRQICAQSSSILSKIVFEITTQLRAWLPAGYGGGMQRNNFSLPSTNPVNFVNFCNLWNRLEETSEVPPAVFATLSRFVQAYSKLPFPARTSIANIISSSPHPSDINKPVEVYLLKYYYSLEEVAKNELEDILTIIISDGFGDYLDKNHTTHEIDDEIHIKSDRYFQLRWRVYEPDLEVFAAINFYYRAKFTTEQLFSAFQNSDFSLVD